MSNNTFEGVMEAAGDFRTYLDVVEFDAEQHPLNQWAKRPESRVSLLNSPHVIGVAFVDTDHNLKLLHALHHTMGSDDSDPSLYGHLGDKPILHRTVVIKGTDDDQIFMADVVIPIPADMVPNDRSEFPISVGPVMNQNNLAQNSVELNGDTSYLASVPVMLPLVSHHPLVEGHVTSDRVKQGLLDYGPVGQVYLEAVLWLKSRPNDSLFAMPETARPAYGSRHRPCAPPRSCHKRSNAKAP